MSGQDFYYDRKADIIFHLRRGPVIVPRSDLKLFSDLPVVGLTIDIGRPITVELVCKNRVKIK